MCACAYGSLSVFVCQCVCVCVRVSLFLFLAIFTAHRCQHLYLFITDFIFSSSSAFLFARAARSSLGYFYTALGYFLHSPKLSRNYDSPFASSGTDPQSHYYIPKRTKKKKIYINFNLDSVCQHSCIWPSVGLEREKEYVYFSISV